MSLVDLLPVCSFRSVFRLPWGERFLDTIPKVLGSFHFWHPYLFRVQVHVVDHCNLNCRGCSTYSPLVREGFADVKQVKKDLCELSRKLHVSVIGIIGGEPLLHPEIEALICVARKAFPNAVLTLTTNGILLPEKSRCFWDVVRDNKVRLICSCYPPYLHKVAQWVRLAKKYGVKVFTVGRESSHNWVVYHHSFRADASRQEANYALCTSKIRCHRLWHSKLFLCNECCLQHYNSYFGTNHQPIKGYDIYRYSGKELQKFMNQSDFACRYCTWVFPSLMTDWSYSKREKSEWCKEQEYTSKKDE